MTDRARRISITTIVTLALAVLTWTRIHAVSELRPHGWLVTYTHLADRILAGHMPYDQIGDFSPTYLWLMVAMRAVGLDALAICALQLVALTLSAVFCAVAAKRIAGWPGAIATAVLILGNRAAFVIATELDPKTLIFFLTSAAFALLATRLSVVGSRLSEDRPILPGESRAGGGLLSTDNRQPTTETEATRLSVVGSRLSGDRPTLPDESRVGGGLPTTDNRQPATSRVVVAALLLGLAAVTHPYGYLVLIVLAIVHRRAALLAALIPIAFVPLAYVIAIAPKTAGHSSSQFYEGNNPLASGAAGVAPRVVADLQATMHELSPDPVYRMLGVDWRAKALANLREYPVAAMQRFGWKALLTVHNFDVYDVITAKEKSIRLARLPSIPFGAAFALAIAAFALRRSRRELWPAACVAIVLMLALTLFVVSARQRNVLLVPLAILGGVGAAEIITLARARNERALLAFGAVIIATALLGIEGRPMREHEYKWTGLAEPDSPEALFDRALILERRGAWPQADALLASIADYRPMRENRAVSSVAYYRAVAGLHLRVPPTVTRELLDRAEREAPGDPHVLALRAVTVDPDAARILDALHDPYTRDFAFALALNAIGEHDRARAMLDALSRRKPRGGAPVPSPAGPAAPSPPSTTDATGAAAPAGPPARASAFRRARLSQTTPQWFERSRAVEPASSSKPPLLRSTAGRFPRSVSSATL